MFVMCFFLLERDLKRKNYCDCLGNSIPYKVMFVSASFWSCTVGEDAFLVAKLQFYEII